MESFSAFREWSDNQRQVYAATVAAYQAYLEACLQQRPFKGGMHWKRIKGREYLYQYRDRLGHGHSLGPRSPHTEQLLAEFHRHRQESRERLQSSRRRLAQQARFCRAATINRLPQTAARVLRCLEQHAPGTSQLVVGAAALYAYEFAAGVMWTGPESQQLLEDSRQRLTLAGKGKWSAADFLGLLHQADRSFTPVPGESCRAVNRHGFRVQLLKPGERRPGKYRAIIVPGAEKPLPPDAGNLQFLVASPKLSQVVIGKDGLPAPMVVPDPRAFALHRLWLSQQEDRSMDLRTRDYRQALAVAALVLGHLPQYDYSSLDLAMFPPDLGNNIEEIEGEATLWE